MHLVYPSAKWFVADISLYNPKQNKHSTLRNTVMV